MICHVLRYSPFYMKMREVIKSGEIGDAVTISQTENVAYWHDAHSYVRGAWRNREESSPMILAKCCHDLDIIFWLLGRSCKKFRRSAIFIISRKKTRRRGARTDVSVAIKTSEKIALTTLSKFITTFTKRITPFSATLWRSEERGKNISANFYPTKSILTEGAFSLAITTLWIIRSSICFSKAALPRNLR